MRRYVVKFAKKYHDDVEVEVEAKDKSAAVRMAVLSSAFEEGFKGRIPYQIQVERVYDDLDELAEVLVKRYEERGA